jgi:ketosteroid isomerase-like protein
MTGASMTTAHELLEATFRALERSDKAAVMALIADDAVFFDPHYPVPEMRGRAAIEKGIDWGIRSMQQFGFTTVRVFSSPDGGSAAFEIDTHHVLKGGMKLNFPQAFFVEAKDGKIIGLRAYEPYGPNGVGGIFLGLSRLKQKLLG